MPATLHKINLSSAKLKALGPNERYVFVLVGHIFNELMTLQKVMLVSQPPTEAHPFITDAGMTLSIIWLRLMVGKTHEAITCLKRESVQQVLRAQFFAPVEGLSEQWEAALQKYEDLTWLQRIRNSKAFHYMTQAQWSVDLRDEDCDEAYVIVGPRNGDILFQWPEQRAAIPMLKLVNEDAPFEGLATMLKELAGLMSMLGECLAHGAQAFIHERLIDDDSLEAPEQVPAPKFESSHLPYFFE